MKLQDLLQGILIFCVILLVHSSIVVAEQIYQCVNNEEDFQSSGWKISNNILHWAKDRSELAEEFKDNLFGQHGDVFYYDNTSSWGSPFLYNDFSLGDRSNGPSYLYLKYYAHSADKVQYYIQGRYEGNMWLTSGTDYVWQELLIRLKLKARITIQANHLNNNHLFFDTIIYTTGEEYNISTDMEAVKSLCHQNNSTLPTSRTPVAPYFICVDTEEDFENHWQSYPFHNYATNSSQLSGDLKRLSGNGIFYLEGSNSFKNLAFFKNFRDDANWNNMPMHLYIKYYSRYAYASNKKAHVRPTFLVPGGQILELPTRRHFKWNEVILQIEGAEKIIEIGIENFNVGDYFLIDKIALARSNNYFGVLELIQRCVKD